MNIRGKRFCPKCKGSGLVKRLVLDEATGKEEEKQYICSCAGQVGTSPLGIPPRLEGYTFNNIVDWWNRDANRQVNEGRRISAADMAGRPEGAVSFASRIGEIEDWARSKKGEPVDFWWIWGPPMSCRSTLAAATLETWCDTHDESGLFVSVREAGKLLLNALAAVYDFNATAIRSEREIIQPMVEAPLLVLDDWDRMENDLRVATSLAQMVDARYHERKTTIFVAGSKPQDLWAQKIHPITKTKDESLQRRLERGRMVCTKVYMAGVD